MGNNEFSFSALFDDILVDFILSNKIVDSFGIELAR
jgi:hypothetical protein